MAGWVAYVGFALETVSGEGGVGGEEAEVDDGSEEKHKVEFLVVVGHFILEFSRTESKDFPLSFSLKVKKFTKWKASRQQSVGGGRGLTSAGIDIGTQNTVIAAVMKGGIDIILNESSNRTSPTIVGYTKEERLAGTPASNQIKANFKNTIQFANRFLGLPWDSAQKAVEKRFIPNKLVPADEGRKVAFEIKNREENIQVLPEEVMGCFLKKMRNFLLLKGVQSTDVVVTVPSYYSAAERQAVMDATQVAGLNLLKLINESSAITYSYGLFRKDDFTSKPRYVVFLDLGHGKLTVTVAQFTKEKGKILAESSNRNVGARNFDKKLMDVLSDRFQQKYDLDPRESPKCRLRMLDVIEKGRKILSGN